VSEHAANKLEVKVLSAEGLATHGGLRVMGVRRQRRGLSVDRGKCGHGIELRNMHWGRRPCWVIGKATRERAFMASLLTVPRSQGTVARMDAGLWNTGDPVISRCKDAAARRSKVCDRTGRMHDGGRSDTVIVVTKRANKCR
jgi:hypothetical protein